MIFVVLNLVYAYTKKHIWFLGLLFWFSGRGSLQWEEISPRHTKRGESTPHVLQRCIYIYIVCYKNRCNKSRGENPHPIPTFHGNRKLHASLLLTLTVSSRSGWIGIHGCLASAQVGAHQIDTLSKHRAVILGMRSTFIPVCKTKTRTSVR